MSNATERPGDSSLDGGLTLDEAMSASEILKSWLPKLNHYQAQLQSTPSHEPKVFQGQSGPVPNDVKVEMNSEEFFASEVSSVKSLMEPPTIPQPAKPSIRRSSRFGRGACRAFRTRWRVIRQPSRPKLVHLPIDGILAAIQKRKPFMLGLGCCGDMDEGSRKTLAGELASRLSDKLDRRTLLVSVFTPELYESLQSQDAASGNDERVQVKSIAWQSFEDSKSGKAIWNNQLAKLVIQKRDYELLIFDLGNAASESMLRMGRLCDGVLIQLLAKLDSRKAIETIQPLQANRLPILGVWTV